VEKIVDGDARCDRSDYKRDRVKFPLKEHRDDHQHPHRHEHNPRRKKCKV
jgi:hypothetical protein